MKRFWGLCILLSLSSSIHAQDSIRDAWNMEARGYYGFIIPHHRGMRHLTGMHFGMGELAVSRNTHGRHRWEYLYRYPTRGILFLYSNLNGSTDAGALYAALPFLNFPLIAGKKTSLCFRFASGIGYFSKPFDRKTNYRNIAIGSHLNAVIQATYEIRYRLSRRFELSAGVGLTHISNGSFKTPNLGFNIPAINASVLFRPGKIQAAVPVSYSREYSRKPEFRLYAFGGISELYGAGGKKYYAGSISFTALKPVSPNKKLGMGADVFSDGAVVESLRREGRSAGFSDALRPGLNVSYMLDFSRLHLLIQAGSYVYTLYKGDGYIYNRFFLVFDISSKISAGLSLKTHLTRADMLEAGIGYKF